MKRLFLIVLPFLVGCAGLSTVSLSSIPSQRNNAVRAEASKIVFLGFTFDNDFVDEMEAQLKAKCPNGLVAGILTKDEVIDYFLFIVWKHRVTATGYCVTASTAKIGSPRHPGSEDDSSGEMQ